MFHDLKKTYWCLNIEAIITEYVGANVGHVLEFKARNVRSHRLTGTTKRFLCGSGKRITIDFVTKLPKTSKRNEQSGSLSSSYKNPATNLYPTRETDSMETLTRFWQSLQSALGTQLNMSTTYHPETDGQVIWVIQTLEAMLLRAFTFIDLEKDGKKTLYTWLEFSY
ncbi:putative reverse transcriptase domain-containing protein [Tanacetum coccineum]